MNQNNVPPNPLTPLNLTTSNIKDENKNEDDWENEIEFENKMNELKLKIDDEKKKQQEKLLLERKMQEESDLDLAKDLFDTNFSSLKNKNISDIKLEKKLEPQKKLPKKINNKNVKKINNNYNHNNYDDNDKYDEYDEYACDYYDKYDK